MGRNGIYIGSLREARFLLACGGYRSRVQSMQAVSPGRITRAFPLNPATQYEHANTYEINAPDTGGALLPIYPQCPHQLGE